LCRTPCPHNRQNQGRQADEALPELIGAAMKKKMLQRIYGTAFPKINSPGDEFIFTVLKKPKHVIIASWGQS